MDSVFFSYSHRDETLRDQLEIQLTMLKRQHVISTWHDRRLIAGDGVDRGISRQIEAADIILLLVSPDFLASEYCYSVEMTRALERHAAGEARVIPVILRPCEWHHAPFGHLLASPTDGKPVTKWADADDAFLSVAKAIRAAATTNDLRKAARPKPEVDRRTDEQDARSIHRPGKVTGVVPGGKPPENVRRSANLPAANAESPPAPAEPVSGLRMTGPSTTGTSEGIPMTTVSAQAAVATPSVPEQIERQLTAQAATEETKEAAEERLTATVALFPELPSPSPEVQLRPEVDFFAEAIRSSEQSRYEAALQTAAGDGIAIYHLGVMHELGLGVRPDLGKARGCYIRAARKHRNGDAMNSLGLLYQHGEGVIHSERREGSLLVPVGGQERKRRGRSKPATVRNVASAGLAIVVFHRLLHVCIGGRRIITPDKLAPLLFNLVRDMGTRFGHRHVG